MKNKKAIEILKPLTECSVDDNGIGTFPMVSTPLQVEALNLAIKALEEARPIEKWECVEDDNYAGGGYWECPSCKTRFSFRGFNMLNDMPYCPRCGDRVKTELEAENEQ